MIGLEYVCTLYNKQYKDVAEELGISKQVVNSWIKGRCNISKKHIPKLTEIFKQDEEYFQKKITEIDKLQIQKRKLYNETREFEYEDTFIDEETGEEVTITKTHIDEGDVFGQNYIDYEIDRKKLIQRIEKTLEETFEQDNSNGYSYASLVDTEYLLNLYSMFISIIANKGIRQSTIRGVLLGMKKYQKTAFTSDKLSRKICDIIKSEEERLTEDAKQWLPSEIDDLL